MIFKPEVAAYIRAVLEANVAAKRAAVRRALAAVDHRDERLQLFHSVFSDRELTHAKRQWGAAKASRTRARRALDEATAALDAFKASVSGKCPKCGRGTRAPGLCLLCKTPP